jgi:Chaperone of endosialidase
MKTLNRFLLILIGALALAGVAFAQVPSTNDTSTTDGNQNTGMGTGALGVGTTGSNNTASGFGALNSNTSGFDNTASGVNSLFSNTKGAVNTAAGYEALYFNTTGNNNTAFGASALIQNTTGFDNTASGGIALELNTTGYENTAVGFAALQFNKTGFDNTASGYSALFSNTTGNYNSASGMNALFKNTTGTQNTASGYQALYANRTGGGNTAFGLDALYHNTSGHYNIAEGYKAGFNLTTGSYNIDIGNSTTGVAGESGVIRIGTQVPTALQTNAYIAGIYPNTIANPFPVVIDSTGHLGVGSTSSERFKTAIAPMGSNTAKLQQLRPVTFHLKTDPKGALQYGLIAEEVAKVYPELVIRGEKGRIDGVRYDELAPMLLNEVQQQQRKIAEQAAIIRSLERQQWRYATQAELHDLKQQLQAALLKLQSTDERVARR